MNGLGEIGPTTTEAIGFSRSHDRSEGQAPRLASRKLRMPPASLPPRCPVPSAATATCPRPPGLESRSPRRSVFECFLLCERADAVAARLATEHLLALGHVSIAHIGGDQESERDLHLPTNRRVGHEAALEAAGISPDPALFHPADFTIAGGYAAAKQLFGCPTTSRWSASTIMNSAAFLDSRRWRRFPSRRRTWQWSCSWTSCTPVAALGSSNTPPPFELMVRSSTARPSAR